MRGGGADDVPELVPARMLNEFVYCPRLFYLEWVAQEFEDNEDTAAGRWLHRHVDEGGRGLPDPADLADDVAARSVMLDAPRLGMVARIDLVEGAEGAVSPVERKHGRPRQDGGLWEPEELQVVAQALILRENGYRVEQGIVSFPETRQRIPVPITPERERRLRERLGELRRTAAGPPPPPLEDSPKCPRCSLVGICLPDETRLLAAGARGRRAARARRLLVPADDASPLYVQEQGARIGRRGGRIEVTRDGERLASVRALDVASVGVFGNVGISPTALRGFCEDGVTITHHTYGGWLVGVTSGPGHRNAGLRIAQFRAAADAKEALAISRGLVDGKLRNQRTLLRRNHRGEPDEALRELTRCAARATRAQDAATLLGIEGLGARAYFGQFAGMLAGETSRSPGFAWRGRNRRPPRDPINALLSFAYSLLLRETTAACVRVGFDPYVGFYHRPRYGRPALALDLAEEFRPLVADSTVLRLVNNRQVPRGHFVVRGGAWALDGQGRRKAIAAHEERMANTIHHPLFGYRVSYRRAIELQARVLARVLTREIPEYAPFVTR